MGLGHIVKSIGKLEDFKKKGYKEVCPGCQIVYKEKPKEIYYAHNSSREIIICKCGCDLFQKIDETISELKEKRDSYKG